MGNKWGLRLHFIFVTIYLVTAINTGLSARNTTVACFEHERLALLKFKHSVTDDHDMLSSWVGNDCCRWERVTCDGVTRNVESLHLAGGRSSSANYHFASNDVSSSLGELRYLKYLDLSQNDFQGSRIPEFIGSLKQLTYLNLHGACFSGIIPSRLGNLSNLKILDLNSNGCYPNLIAHDMSWISGLSSLEHLDLSFVNFSGSKNLDMVIYMIPSLKELRLSKCSLCNADFGHIRNSSTSLSNIKHLDLSYNSFKGKLPHFFLNMTSLQFLDLSTFDFTPTWNFANFLSMNPSLSELRMNHCNLKETYLSRTLHNFTTLTNTQHFDKPDNNLTGPIPTPHWKLTKLYLSGNCLKGSIPESVGKFSLLQVLDLSHNKLTGVIPTFPAKLSKLNLYGNYLNGSIPDSLGRLAALTFLNIGCNQLSGTIPVSIGQLTKLRYLDVSSNSLEGVIFESHFANLSMLKGLNVASSSKLTFNFSREWLPPFQLIDIDLSSCKIANGFPQWLQNQRKLKVLELSHANISGPLPTWLQKMPVITMHLSHNSLSGSLPDFPNEVKALFLQNNLFNESIPRSLCKMTGLLYLDLSRNMLSGKIPNCFWNLQNVKLMKLNSNGLSGVIPSSIGQLASLTSLNLNDNNFSGDLPAEFWNLSHLNVLDVGDNAFRGKIPEWIGEKYKWLRVFRLHKNNFTGGIPRSLCTNIELQILDVAHNDLTGTIPHCLGELQGMINNTIRVNSDEGAEEGVTQVIKGIALEYTRTWQLVINMDLSSNKLVGEIPIELTALRELLGLNLSNNHLSGGIPGNIGNMKALNSLDFSGNELSGPIPPSIAYLNFLSHLNLSNNNLSGQIPTGNQLQTLDDPSIYGGNKELCGAPLPKNCSANQEDSTAIAKKNYEAANEPNKVWFYLDIMCGFATGFWGVIIVLVLKKQWRNKLFMFAKETIDKIHVAVMVRVNKIMTRGREAI